MKIAQVIFSGITGFLFGTATVQAFTHQDTALGWLSLALSCSFAQWLLTKSSVE